MNYPLHHATKALPQRNPLTLALRAAIVGLTFSLAAPTLVNAEEAAVSTQVQQFNIAAGTLDIALEQFARTAGVNLNYDASQLNSKITNGVQGSYDANRALNILLQDTGLMAQPYSGGFKITEAGQDLYTLQSINVYGRQKDDSIRAIPQSVNVAGQDTFERGTANSVGDVLSLVPNATRSGSSLDMFSDDYLIRGFNAEQATNGLGFKRNDHPTDLANVERIEVLKGPSSVLFGQMEPGGTVNVVTKQPLDYYQAAANLEYGSFNSQRATLDVTGPINDSVRARLNLAYQDSDSFADSQTYRRLFVAPNVTVDLTERTNLTVEGSYSNNDWTALQGGTPIEGAITSNPNGDYAKSFNAGWTDSFTERDSKNINLRLTHALTDSIDARFSYNYTRNDADWAEYVPFGLDDSDFRTLSRLMFVGKDTYKKDHEVVMDLSGEFETGDLNHTFIAGLNYQDKSLSRPNQLYLVDSIDIYSPQYTAAVLGSGNLMRDRTLLQDDQVLAAFLQDRISLNDELSVLVGARYTDSEQSQTTVDHGDNDSQTQDSLNQTNWAMQLGVIYDLTETTSVYANRSESFVPQQGTTSGKKPLEAEESTQYEVGMRIEVGDLNFNAASFVIDKENIAIEDPLDDDFEIAAGSARSKGIELTLDGYLTPDWYFNAAYGYTDTEILNSDDADLEGNRFANVPLHTASLQSQYHINAVPGLSFSGTLRYVGERYGDDDNSFKLPAHTRLDLATYYAISDELQIDLLIDNVLDEEIFSPGAFDGVVREPERTYKARLKYRF